MPVPVTAYAREGYLVCPGCGGLMLSLDSAGARCQSCFGVWFDWFDGETSGLAQKVPRLDAAETRARSGGSCPRDGARLEPHEYLDGGPLVDRCPECLGLFAARAQLLALAEFHERMPADSPEPIERASLLARLWHAFGR
jgi:Zn-finger nucleic acid-binding protein